MVDISNETTAETERRLRRVVTEASLVVYDDNYAFHEYPISKVHEYFDISALAIVRDDSVCSQLERANEKDEESFVVWRFHFPAGIDNSGFVGWLAGHLKAKFGTGVFVVCGQNSQQGGIFDYWGAPASIREQIIKEVKKLVGGAADSSTKSALLNGVKMNVVETSASSVIDTDTVFQFEQNEDVVHARYSGGAIVAGTLIGKLIDDQLQFAFSQLEAGSVFSTGNSQCTVSVVGDKIELTENFEWSEASRPPGVNKLQQVRTDD